MPFLFAAQQALEGTLWLALEAGNRALAGAMALAYSFFARVLWPAYIPWAVLAMEAVPWRRRALLACAAAGAAVGLAFLLLLAAEPPSASVVHGRIAYRFPTFLAGPLTAAYLAATGGALLLSSHRWVAAFGILASASAAVAYYAYATTFASVWCFFAAVLSAIVLLHLRRVAAGAAGPIGPPAPARPGRSSPRR